MKIKLEHISKNYGKRNVLKDVSMVTESGSCVGVLGGNGCGKSTLLAILSGTRRATSGRFMYEDRDIFKDKRLRTSLVGYVPQGTPLIEELSARDNLLIFYEKKKLEKELKNGSLELLGINEFINVPVKKMSGGMKKRLMIGCAVANHPKILLLDEPSAALDLICKRRIAGYLEAYKRIGGTIFLATHDEEEIRLCDNCFILKDGGITEYMFDGDVDKLVSRF
ncbi:MAG: ABC transporter ATP-binding protein [Lachnospiraceae bacterium]|nr:ABC transporter ATP-binding protein [Lachnospiraceae bacterium]